MCQAGIRWTHSCPLLLLVCLTRQSWELACLMGQDPVGGAWSKLAG